jgi:hypothetical protein
MVAMVTNRRPSPPLSLQVSTHATVAFVVVVGPLTAAGCATLTDAVDELARDPDRHRVVVDVSCAVLTEREAVEAVDRLAARRGEGIVVHGEVVRLLAAAHLPWRRAS